MRTRSRSFDKITLKKISIRNYKGIDSLELYFPEPLMQDESNVCVLGSKNGVGKTSLLECVTLLVLAAFGELEEKVSDIDLDFIRAGAASATIQGEILVNNEIKLVKVTLNTKGNVTVEGLIKNLPEASRKIHTVGEVMGMTPEPVCAHGVFFIHGYRKIQEGRIDLGRIVGENESLRMRRSRFVPIRWREQPLSTFKTSILEWQLSRADLLDYPTNKKLNSDVNALQILGELLEKYAGVKLGKIRPYGDGTMSILVVDKNNDKIVFPIDGLSSGQKEIISTLFMIWENTRTKSTVVLIDEPELHLNAQWHKSFVADLMYYAPNNQYVIATHSEQIMDSVAYDNRVMLHNNN